MEDILQNNGIRIVKGLTRIPIGEKFKLEIVNEDSRWVVLSSAHYLAHMEVSLSTLIENAQNLRDAVRRELDFEEVLEDIINHICPKDLPNMSVEQIVDLVKDRIFDDIGKLEFTEQQEKRILERVSLKLV